MKRKSIYGSGKLSLGQVKFVLTEANLGSIIRAYLQQWSPEDYFIKVPVLGNVKNQLKSISLQQVEIKTDGIYIRIFCEIRSFNQRRIPSFRLTGSLEILSKVVLALKDNLEPDFQIDIFEFQWKQPPVIKGAIFSITPQKQISKLLESRIPDLEAKLLQTMLDGLSLKNLVLRQLNKILPQKVVQHQYVSPTMGEIDYSQVTYQDGFLWIEVNGSFTWKIYPEFFRILETDWLNFKANPVEGSSQLSLPFAYINHLIPHFLPVVNQKIQKSRITIKSIYVSSTTPYINFKIDLEGGLVDDFIMVRTFVRLDKERQLLLLKDLKIDHVSESSLFLKGMLFLFAGKLENLIFKYFPLDLAPPLKRLHLAMVENQFLGLKLQDSEIKLSELTFDVDTIQLIFDHGFEVQINGEGIAQMLMKGN